MMAKATQLNFVLFMLLEITVCDDVFKLVNSSVQLDIPKTLKSFGLSWKFNTKTNIVYTYKDDVNVHDSYKDRVEFNKETLSLTLKNLQKNDSGVYEAEAVGQISETLATYKLHVLDPVEKPTLNDSLQKNNETCNVTLLCEAQHLSVTSHCSSDKCDEKEAKSEFLSLSLYVSESFIICNHSNPVSWKNTTMAMKHVKDLCPPEEKNPKPIENTTLSPLIIGIIIVIVIIIIIIIIIIIFCQWKKRRTAVSNLLDVNTCYEDVPPFNTGGRGQQSIEMSNSHESPATLYCTVGMPDSKDKSPVSTASPGNKEMDASNMNDQEAENIHNTENINSPQTVYATVNKVVCDVFKLVNSSVQLDIPKTRNFSGLYWRFNKTKTIVYLHKDDLTVYGSYKGRVEFNKETLSLTLKNLQKYDSGVYEAEAVGQISESLATYKLHVLDPVEKPTLNDSLQKNDETCNVTLLCEAQHLSVTSHCSSKNCDEKEAKSEFLSLSLYVSESFIICNHSNSVSWKNTTMAMKHVEDLCPSEGVSMHRYCMV